MERCMLTFINLEDFGFKHIMWVYSGRRGVHCWVSDERARRLNNESRKAIVGFLEVIKVITASISGSFLCILIYGYRVVLKVLARSSYRLHYILHLRKSSNSIRNQPDLYILYLDDHWTFWSHTLDHYYLKNKASWTHQKVGKKYWISFLMQVIMAFWIVIVGY